MKKRIIVAGGGPTGTVAAIASARSGAETIIIERGEALGGVASAGGLSVWGPFDDGDRFLDWDRDARIEANQPLTPEMAVGKRVIKGIAEEILNRLTEMGGTTDYGYGFIPLNPEYLKIVLEEMLTEAGAGIIYGSQIYDVKKNGSRISSVRIANKNGSSEITGDVFIDATGDADLAAFAGVPFEKGRTSDGKMQGVTLVFKMGGTDFPGRFYQSREDMKNANAEFEKAYKRGEISHLCTVGCINKIPAMDGVVAINTQHTYDIDATDPEALKRAIIKGHRECFDIAKMFRKYLRGFEKSFLLDTAPFIGIRETRRIKGAYTMTKEDILNARQFEDSIGRNAYNIDIHIPGQQSFKPEEICLKPGTSYTIPYRSLLPEGIDNLLVAGRSISSTHEAQSSLRIMPCCMVTGEAAGTAGALAAAENIPVFQLDIKKLQVELKKNKVLI